MSTKDSKASGNNGSGVFTLDGANYGSTSGGPQPLAGLTGAGSGTDFAVQGSPSAGGPGLTTSDGMISPIAGAMYQKVYNSDPYIVGSGNYAFNVNPQATGNIDNTGNATAGGNIGYGAPLDAAALGQGARQNQTGNSHLTARAQSFTPGILESLAGGTGQGNNLIALLQKMKVGSTT